MSGELVCNSETWRQFESFMHNDNPKIVAVSGCVLFGLGTLGLGTLACMAQVYGAQRAFFDTLKYFESADDHAIIMKLSGEDCGGLSKMTTGMQGCFRYYATEAICRQAESPNYDHLKNIFQRCFVNREFDCEWRNHFSIPEILATDHIQSNV